MIAPLRRRHLVMIALVAVLALAAVAVAVATRPPALEIRSDPALESALAEQAASRTEAER